MAANVVAKPSETVRVEDRVRSGLCLVQGCDCEAVTRGVCMKHYRQFKRAMQAKGKQAEQAEFESRAIKKGVILPTYGVATITRPNAFEDV